MRMRGTEWFRGEFVRNFLSYCTVDSITVPFGSLPYLMTVCCGLSGAAEHFFFNVKKKKTLSEHGAQAHSRYIMRPQKPPEPSITAPRTPAEFKIETLVFLKADLYLPRSSNSGPA